MYVDQGYTQFIETYSRSTTSAMDIPKRYPNMIPTPGKRKLSIKQKCKITQCYACIDYLNYIANRDRLLGAQEGCLSRLWPCSNLYKKMTLEQLRSVMILATDYRLRSSETGEKYRAGMRKNPGRIGRYRVGLWAMELGARADMWVVERVIRSREKGTQKI